MATDVRHGNCKHDMAPSVVQAAVGAKVGEAACSSAAMHVAMDESIKEGARNKMLRKGSSFNWSWCDKEKENIRGHLACLERIHRKRGMTDEFVQVFDELYEEALRGGIMPREHDEWKKIRVSQVMHNLRRAFDNNDRSRFTWFMYMMMRFVLSKKEGEKKDQAEGDDLS